MDGTWVSTVEGEGRSMSAPEGAGAASMTGRVAVVTGGAGAFGSAVARAFAHAGAVVVVADIDGDRAGEVAAALPAAHPVVVDVADPDSVRDLVAHVEERFGGLHIMVNNAGAAQRSSPMADLAVAEVDRILQMNVRSVFLGCAHAVPALRRSGGGAIVNVASIGGRRPRPRQTIYNASKAAVIGLTRGLAGEVAPQIRVNVVNPLVSDTPFVRQALGVDHLDEATLDRFRSTVPMGRLARPEDVASAVLFLASDAASFLTGVSLDVDGGRSIQ